MKIRYIFTLSFTFLLQLQGTFAQQNIYWTDQLSTQPSIRCVDTSGISCKDKTAANNTVLLNLTIGDFPSGLVIDEKNQKVIWVNAASVGSIERCNFDGSSRQTIVTSQAFPEHLTIDYLNNKLYWTIASGIYKSNLDGSSVESLSGVSGSNFTGIAVDSTNSLLFWSQGLSVTQIYKSSISNISATNFLFLQPGESIFGLTLNPSSSRVYWNAQTSLQASLQYSASYQASASISNLISTLPGTNSQSWKGLAIDYPETNIYFANKSEMKIYKSSLTPASAAANVFLSNAGDVSAIALSCGRYATDTDADGAPDCAESCDNDANKTVAGVCGCGVSDVDTDKDGTVDCIDACPSDSSKIVAGVCGCGVSDADSDKDGILDCQDACPNDANKIAAGICGCGFEDEDSDSDEVVDCDDECPEDERKSEEGLCGCGLIEDINSEGTEVCAKNRQLTPNTKIENPPIIEVEGDKAIAVFEKFVKPTLTLKKKKKNAASSYEIFDFNILANSSKFKVAYEIQITKTDSAKREVKKLTSKRNRLTVKNLDPGNYDIKYRAVITEDGEPVSKTKFSPSNSFSIS